MTDEAGDVALANVRLLFAGFAVLHVVFWTALPLVFLHALPVDLVEGVIWGQGWQLGYDQPPFQAWLLGSIDWLFGYQRWAVYLSSQILVATCLWAVWRLARLIVSPLGALVSALLLEGVFYFNIGSPNLFPDVIEMPFWALATWSFYRALRFGVPRDWALLGLCLAAAAYAKYVSAVLAAVMIGFMLFEPRARRCWRTPGPYLCAVVCLLLLAPHLRWAVQQHFPTIEHVQHSARPTVGVLDQLLALAGFAGGQLPVTMWVGLLVLALNRSRQGVRPISLAAASTAFDRRFVATLALGPLLIMLVGAAVSGVQFRVHWTYAMWSFIGLFAVVFLVPAVDALALRRFARAWAGVFLLAVLVYAGANSFASHIQPPSAAGIGEQAPFRHVLVGLQLEMKHGLDRLQREADFPSRELAEAITERWHETVGSPLAYVVGNKWVAGNISFFSPDHPLVLRDGSPEDSPWINEAEFWHRGAVVAWNPDFDTNNISAALQRRFPMMEVQPPIVLASRSGTGVAPLQIMWGIVRPAPESAAGDER